MRSAWESKKSCIEANKKFAACYACIRELQEDLAEITKEKDRRNEISKIKIKEQNTEKRNAELDKVNKEIDFTNLKVNTMHTELNYLNMILRKRC